MTLELKVVLAFMTVLAFNYLLGSVVPVPTGQILLAVLAIVAIRCRKRLYIIIRTFPRDVRFAKRLISLLLIHRKLKNENVALCHVFTKRAVLSPDTPLIYFNDEIWTNRDIEVYSNRVANAFLAQGMKKGDTVALFMGNCPEQICMWLGLSKLGVITALINYNLRNQPLAHCVNVVGSCAIICGGDLASAVKGLGDKVHKPLPIYQFGGDTVEDAKDLKKIIEEASPEPPACPQPSYNDKLIYIFTSGTTGLPKAAVIPNSRFITLALGTTHILLIGKDDCMYTPLPLYHLSGTALGVGTSLISGAKIVIKTKFSASAYFPDCVKYKCTVGQYIGEMCRYILASPRKPDESKHNLRFMCGNGLRFAIWKEFMERFNIPRVAEFYGSTEGNASLVNLDNTVGAIGFLPQSLPQSFYPICLVRADLETGEIFRTKDGMCVRSEIGEPGMCLGLINNRDPTRQFHGYSDKSASQKKIVSNVFEEGDTWFNTGDILVMDELGYLFFKDRTGETFRWKGENVSSAEVESVIVSTMGPRAVAVYGVEVPGTEGRAGMAAIAEVDGTQNLELLARGLDSELPAYARPIFVRIAKELEMTGTFKIKKGELANQGFNPAVTKDQIYLREGPSYVLLTVEKYSDIMNGKIRL